MSILPNLICRFNIIKIKISASYFVDNNKLILKFICKGKGPRIANTILKKKNKVSRLTLPNFKTYYSMSSIIKTTWYLWRNRHVDQWNRRESPKIDPHKYNQLIFGKGAEVTQWRKGSLVNKRWLNKWWWMSTCKKMNLDTDLTPYILMKNNSKWTIDLNVWCKTIEHLEDNIR